MFHAAQRRVSSRRPILSISDIENASNILYAQALKSNKDMFNYIQNLTEKYLYDSESPMKNDLYFSALLKSQLSQSKLNDIDKVRINYLYDLASKNNPGAEISNFNIELSDGTKSTLKSILPNNNTIIFFNDPNCEKCNDIKMELDINPSINQKINNDELSVIAI